MDILIKRVPEDVAKWLSVGAVMRGTNRAALIRELLEEGAKQVKAEVGKSWADGPQK